MMHGSRVRGNERSGDVGREDQQRAERERAARQRLAELGADALAPRPWQAPPVPPSAVDLILFFLWHSGRAEPGGTAGPDRVGAAQAALELLPAARDELDQIEAGLLFSARGLGLTWKQMADALGLNSPQACQQRLERLTTRRRPHGEDPSDES
jgi:hypothetical protein